MNCINLTTAKFQVDKNTGVSDIGERAFYNCRKLEKIEVPGSVLNIGPYAFAASGIYKALIGKGVETIRSYAFANCKALELVQIPDTVSKIYDHAFAECTALTEVRLSGNTARIDATAFNGCTALEQPVPEATPQPSSEPQATPKPTENPDQSFPIWNPDLIEAYRFMISLES